MTENAALERVREMRRKFSKFQHEADYWKAELERSLRILRRAKRHSASLENWRQLMTRTTKTILTTKETGDAK